MRNISNRKTWVHPSLLFVCFKLYTIVSQHVCCKSNPHPLQEQMILTSELYLSSPVQPSLKGDRPTNRRLSYSETTYIENQRKPQEDPGSVRALTARTMKLQRSFY